MKALSILSFFLFSIAGFSSELYSKSFGNKENPAIIYLHGGPGYNAASFEVTTAQELSEAGFFVIVYDRRGEGRSLDAKAKFNFKESIRDLKFLFAKYKFEKSALIGHSFGGILATKFALDNPKMVSGLILVGAPVSLQESFKTIINSCKNIYTDKQDDSNLRYITMLNEMDSKSLEYAVYSFAHAMQNGFYSTKTPTNEALSIFEKYKNDTTLMAYASKMTQQATEGFWKNENYTSIDLTDNLKKLKENGMLIFGLYGKEDGLYSPEQIKDLEKIIGEEQLLYIDNCSHSVFIDQQSLFINTLKDWLLAK